MPGDRTPVSPTELAQLSRCEQQVLFDRRFGARRSADWRRRAVRGDSVHAALHRRVSQPPERGKRSMLILGLVIAALLLLLLAFGLRGGAEAHDGILPDELRGAELWQSETLLVRKKPVHVRGRPDEVWVKNGRRYIVETKSRSGGVFDGDRMQLAAYAYLLRETDGPPLAAHGFIRFTGGEGSFAKVKLLPDDAVVEAHRRHQGLARGEQRAEFATSGAVCNGCGHRARCPKFAHA